MDAFSVVIIGFKKISKFLKSTPPKKNTQKKLEDNPIYTRDYVKNSKYTIGEFTYGNPSVFDWNEGTTLIIGRFCSIANDVKIFLGGNHRIDWVTTYPFNVLIENFPNAASIQGHPTTKGDVIIGNDVWIGRGTTIMSGTKIGDGAVIGAYSIVTKEVKPYEIVAGNPARFIRKRFDDDIINSLIKISWWNWPIDKINSEVSHLCQNNIASFIERNLK